MPHLGHLIRALGLALTHFTPAVAAYHAQESISAVPAWASAFLRATC